MSEAIHYMFVVKVCLGHVVYTTGRDGTNAEDGKSVYATARQRDLTTVPGSTTVHYHSLLADPPGYRYREIVNFNSKYTYPAFLIAYRRTSS